MLSISIQAILEDHLVIIEFESPRAFKEEWPLFEKMGYKPYYKALREDVSARMTDVVFEAMDKATDENVSGLSCPRHGKTKIWDDKKKKGHHYCGHKMDDGGWCGITWNNFDEMSDRRASPRQANFAGPIDF